MQRPALFRCAMRLMLMVTLGAPVLPAQAPPVLVELFTSEGCSSCPPADQLLAELAAHPPAGHPVILLSEHVTYWNRLGWTDPFSAETFTDRQQAYNQRFGTEGPYTPQMIVNGARQFVGSDRQALNAALAHPATGRNVTLTITASQLTGGQLQVHYRVAGLAGETLQLLAALVDDEDRSQVPRGENAGRTLRHVSVARSLTAAAQLSTGGDRTLTLPLPAAIAGSHQPHHVVLFLQQPGLGTIRAADTHAF